MALTAKIVASETLVCCVKAGIKQIPIVGEIAVNVVDGLQRRHQALSDAARMAEFEAHLSRVERGMRDTVEQEVRTILTNLGRPAVPGPELTREMTELRQIYEQGWVPNLFEGILRNSSHWDELRRNPKQYGRILGDHEAVEPENGMHLLLDKDKTRILELPAASLALLLSNQTTGIPAADVRAGQDIWAFPSRGVVRQRVNLPAESERIAVRERRPVPERVPAKTLYKGLVLCCRSKNDQVVVDFARCELTITDAAMAGSFPALSRRGYGAENDAFSIPASKLDYAIIDYDHTPPGPGLPAEFENGISITLVDEEFHFRLKPDGFERMSDAIRVLRKEPEKSRRRRDGYG
jgi:hypothetical protein